MKAEILKMLDTASQKSGIPLAVLYSIVMNESGGDPTSRAITDKEDSRGLFQVNVMAHPDANASQLFNPQYNIDYMLPELTRVYKDAVSKGLSGLSVALYVEKNGERPQWTANVIKNVTKHYTDFVGGNPNSEDSSGGTATVVTETTGGISGVVDKVMGTVKFGAVYFVLLVLLIFGMYVAFIK